MLARSYLILAPATPNDIAAASLNQRQTIPLAWAFAFASPKASLTATEDHTYFSTTVEDALAVLDRALAGWNYNSYFRDTLAPVGVFRTWLANNPPETRIYLNITDLIRRAPSARQDIAELRRLSEKVDLTLQEVEAKHFRNFILELRKLSYPLVTVPITGDREVDLEILTFEIRDTNSPEAEMALQMVGVDRSGALLEAATRSISLRKGKLSHLADTAVGDTRHLTLFTSNLHDAHQLLVDELGCTLLRETPQHLVLKAHGREFLLVKLDEERVVRPEED